MSQHTGIFDLHRATRRKYGLDSKEILVEE
jgi:hypothetical protein